MNWLFSNLNGFIGQKWFMAVVFTIIIMMKIVIITFQFQKDGLREDVSNYKAQLTKTQAEHVAEIDRITVKHNQIIKDMISKEEVIRLENELENEKRKALVELESRKKLNKKLKKLDSIEIQKCELSQELREIINGVIG